MIVLLLVFLIAGRFSFKHFLCSTHFFIFECVFSRDDDVGRGTMVSTGIDWTETTLAYPLAGSTLGSLRIRMVRLTGRIWLTYARYSQVSDHKLALLNTLRFSVWSSRGAGLVLAVDGFLIMLAVCRNLIRFLRPKIRFLPLDENLWFHRQTAYMLLLFAIIHTTAHYVNFFVPRHLKDVVNCRMWKLFERDP